MPLQIISELSFKFQRMYLPFADDLLFANNLNIIFFFETHDDCLILQCSLDSIKYFQKCNGFYKPRTLIINILLLSHTLVA